MDPRGRNASSAVDAMDEFFDFEGLALYFVEIVAVDLNADLCPDAGVEHQNAVLDGLEKCGDVAGDLLHFLRELGFEFFYSHTVPPGGVSLHAEPTVRDILRLEHDRSF